MSPSHDLRHHTLDTLETTRCPHGPYPCTGQLSHPYASTNALQTRCSIEFSITWRTPITMPNNVRNSKKCSHTKWHKFLTNYSPYIYTNVQTLYTVHKVLVNARAQSLTRLHPRMLLRPNAVHIEHHNTDTKYNSTNKCFYGHYTWEIVSEKCLHIISEKCLHIIRTQLIPLIHRTHIK